MVVSHEAQAQYTQRDNYGTSGNYNPNNGHFGTRTPRY
jgi:hypothetical protein